MSRRPASFTQADMARAIRAAMQTGAEQVEVTIPGGKIIVKIEADKSTDRKTRLAKEREIAL